MTGSGVNAMFWCNLLFAVAGWVLFACGTRLSARRQLLVAVTLFVCWYPLQEVFSGTSEPLQFFLLLAGLGAASALQRQFQVGWFLVLAASCALTTVTRALHGAALAVSHRAAVEAAPALGFGQPGWGGALGGRIPGGDGGHDGRVLYANLDMQVFSLLAEGKPVQAVVYGCTKLGTSWPTSGGRGLPPPPGATSGNWASRRCCCCCCWLSRWWGWCRTPGPRRPVAFQVSTLAVVVVSLLGLLEMYEMYAMARHLIMLIFFLVAALACSHLRGLAVCLLLLVLLPYHWQTVTLPTYDGAMDAQMQTVSAALAQREDAQQSDDPWAHTLAYAFRTRCPTGICMQCGQHGHSV